MAIAEDIEIKANGEIRYIGADHSVSGAGYYTVQELHRFAMDLADDAQASGDDIMDITLSTPTGRQTQFIIDIFPPYNIDQTLSEHLFDGSIIQNNGDDIWDGFKNYGNEGFEIYLMQNGIKLTNDFWNNIPDGETTKGLNRDSVSGVSHMFLQKVRTGGVDIDGRRLIGLTREFGKTNKEFKVAGTARGNNILALDNSADLNNTTLLATVAGWTDILKNEGYIGIDVDDNGVDDPFYSKYELGGHPINDLFERVKYLISNGSGETMYGIDGDIFRGVTHEVEIDTNTGTFGKFEPISWAGGTGQMLAINDTASGTKLWMQLLTGVIPTDGQTITGGTSAATVDVNATVLARPLNFNIVGASTGSALIGAYGVGVKAGDLSASDKLTDLEENVLTPPNNVLYSVAGLVIGEDRVLVAPYDGISTDPQGNPIPDEAQLSADGAYIGGEAVVTVKEDIPLDTPSVGIIRIDNGITYSEVPYTSYSGKVFSGCSNVPACADADNIWVAYIDKLAEATIESFTSVYQADRLLMIRVRDGGATPIKTFITTGVLGSSGGAVTVIRTSDA